MKSKRILSLILSVVMLLSVFSIAAYAEDTAEPVESFNSEEVKWAFAGAVINDVIKVKLGESGRIIFATSESLSGGLEDELDFSSTDIILTVGNQYNVEVSLGEMTDKRIKAEPLFVSSPEVIVYSGVHNIPRDDNGNLNATGYNDYIFKVDSDGKYEAVNYGYGYMMYDTVITDAIEAELVERYPNARVYNPIDGFSFAVPEKTNSENGFTDVLVWEDAFGSAIPVEVYANVYRLYNPNSGEHFFTVNKEESDWLTSLGWKYEGIAWYAPGKKENPVYRVYNPNAGDHHYTLDAAEKDWLVSLGWKDEGIAFYSPEQGGTAINRVYNPNAVAGSHFFTQNTGEYNYLDSIGWTAEGTAFYGYQ